MLERPKTKFGILTSEPVGEYGIVLICTALSKLGFCKNGNDSWMELNDDYKDIICVETNSMHSAIVGLLLLGTCPPTKRIVITSLGDRAVFVGVNHSISISTEDLRNCKGNSIYFPGNYWLDENWYGHHTRMYRFGS